jgi:fructokinase
MMFDSPEVICWGEILWDVFPDHAIIGGAPFNVAQRLSSLGANALMISTIGRDKLGDGVLNYMEQKGLTTQGVGLHDSLSTGQVNVMLDDQGAARYTIEDPAAWDDIEFDKEFESSLKSAKVLVFGSLAMRHTANQTRLAQLMLPSLFKVFDVNLRPPHFDLLWIGQAMQKADMVKMNEEELDFLFGSILGFKSTHSIDQKCQKLSSYDDQKVWCITLGGDGARLYCKGIWYGHSGYLVEVVDTVGAGDSFLAALIIGLIIDQQPPEQALDYAVTIGSIVAGSAGANPEISMGDQVILRPK